MAKSTASLGSCHRQGRRLSEGGRVEVEPGASHRPAHGAASTAGSRTRSDPIPVSSRSREFTARCPRDIIDFERATWEPRWQSPTVASGGTFRPTSVVLSERLPGGELPSTGPPSPGRSRPPRPTTPAVGHGGRLLRGGRRPPPRPGRCPIPTSRRRPRRQSGPGRQIRTSAWSPRGSLRTRSMRVSTRARPSPQGYRTTKS